jgi:hypothetical protein
LESTNFNSPFISFCRTFSIPCPFFYFAQILRRFLKKMDK